jgi:hypothetical protein
MLAFLSAKSFRVEVSMSQSSRAIDVRLRKLGLHPPMGRTFGCTREGVRHLEEFVGTTLPRDYSHFLETYGASSFDKSVGFRPVEKCASARPDGLLPFGAFYGITRDPVYSIIGARKSFSSQGSRDDCLPIADGPFGDQVCISLHGPDSGTVFYWTHDADDDAEAFTKVARGFTRFVLSLKELRDRPHDLRGIRVKLSPDLVRSAEAWKRRRSQLRRA